MKQEDLAFFGGPRVRTEPYPNALLGVNQMGEEELAEITEVIRQKAPFRFYGLQTPLKVKTFEEETAKYFGLPYTLALSSGTAALMCAIVALGIGPGDEVILPSFNWYSDFSAIVNAGATPVFADIDNTLCLDPDDFEKKITSKTKAVIPVHFQGCPADMDRIIEIARKHDVKVIEDCAQAFGGRYKGKVLGTIGDIGITSFQQNKVLTCGEGGLFFTSNEEYFVRAVRYHDLGMVRDVFAERVKNKELLEPKNGLIGLVMHMSEIHGAIILAQFRRLNWILDNCRKNHKRLRERFMDNKLFQIRFRDEGDCGNAFYMEFQTAQIARDFSNYLSAEGIRVGPPTDCTKILENEIVRNKMQANPNMPPFGIGFDAEHVIYDDASCCKNAGDILSRMVAIGITPYYDETYMNDIIIGIEKVSNYLINRERIE